MGIFIQINVDEDRLTSEGAEQIASLCPVDIFALNRKRLLTVRPEQEDECTLCELCLDATPAGALTIRKTYMDEQLISRGTALSAALRPLLSLPKGQSKGISKGDGVE